MKQIETGLEKLIFNSRWLLAPFYLGLVLALALMLVKFAKEFLHFAPLVFNAEGGEVIIGVLSLIDVVMVANLLIIIVFAGYENFVSRFEDEAGNDVHWLGKIDFAEYQQQQLASLAAARPNVHAAFFATIEVVATVTIGVIAWRWRPEAELANTGG